MNNYHVELDYLYTLALGLAKTENADDEGIKLAKRTLHRLADRESIKKPIIKLEDDNWQRKYYCPNCGIKLNKGISNNRCSGTSYYISGYENNFGCGQKIDWSDTD